MPTSRTSPSRTNLPKRRPSGVGLWIWQIKRTDRGEIPAIIARLKRAGVSWVMLKTGDTQAAWPRNPMYQGWQPLARALRAAGIGVYGWAYLSAYSADGDVAVILKSLDTGLLDGYILDTEGPQKRPECKAIAREIGRRVRAVYPDAWIAFSPFYNPESHSAIPHTEYMEWCDAVMGQAYWGNVSQPPEWALELTHRQFAEFHKKYPKTRSCEILPTGQFHSVPGEEIRRYLAHPLATTAPSGWVYEYMRREQWDALEAHKIGSNQPKRPSVTTPREMQEALKRLGFAVGTVDGVVGKKTRAAIVAFQRREGLVADGVPGPTTLRRLSEEYDELGKV